MSQRTIAILSALRALILPLSLFGLVTNLTILVSPLFMMQVLDRVVPTGNLNTLVLLLLVALGALVMNALVEFYRDRTLGKAARWLDTVASREVLGNGGEQPSGLLRSIGTLRDFLGGRGALSILDMPWIAVFLLALYLIHPAYLILAGIAAFGFLSLSLASKTLTAPADADMRQAGAQAQDALRNLDLVGPTSQLMGLGKNLSQRYLKAQSAQSHALERADRMRVGFDSASRMLRAMMQIGSLATGAYLVTVGGLSAGGMIGASLILGKCLATVEGTLAAWPGFLAAREAVFTLSRFESSQSEARTELATLSGRLKAANITSPRGKGAAPRVERVSFALEPGACLAILGESGSGKTTLLDALCGIAPAPIGNCFLDETDIRTLDAATRDRLIGYLPQQASLVSGTIADVISRFDPDRDDGKVLSAARLVGVHGLISSLPNAYDTDLATEGHLLSAGQRQRVALARAVYEEPRYLFLDEPNALLDNQGERQLGDAISRLKANGTTIVMTAHRMGIVNLADRILVMEAGRMIEYGPRSEILGRMTNSHRRIRVPVNQAATQDLLDWVARQFSRNSDDVFCQRAQTVATELYNFARQNGPDDPHRRLLFEFNFVDDITCTLMVHDALGGQIERKVTKIRELAKGPSDADALMSQDEASLAKVIRIADYFEHRENAEKCAYFAKLIQEAAPEAAQGAS